MFCRGKFSLSYRDASAQLFPDLDPSNNFLERESTLCLLFHLLNNLHNGQWLWLSW